MIHAPLIQRELQVAARSRPWFWIRFGLSAASVLFGLVWIVQLEALGRQSADGRPLFGFLAFLAWMIALVSGPLLASDAVSMERREGTLGLLHLSSLSAFDILVGKFLAIATRLVLVLAGVLPVLVVCLLMGGITGREVAQAALAVLLTAVVSVGLGLAVSAGSSRADRAFAATAALLVSWLVGGTLAGWTIEGLWPSLAAATLSPWWKTSPWHLFDRAFGPGHAAVTREFLVQSGAALALVPVLLGLGAWRLRRVGPDDPSVSAGSPAAAPDGTRRRRRNPLLFPDEGDPLAILLRPSLASRALIFLPTLVVGILTALPRGGPAGEAHLIVSFYYSIFGTVPLVWMAWRRCHALPDLRSSRMLEVLLTLPPVSGPGAGRRTGGEDRILEALSRSINRTALVATLSVVLLPFAILVVRGVFTWDADILPSLGMLTYGAAALVGRYFVVDGVSLRFGLTRPSATSALAVVVALGILAPILAPCLLDWGVILGLLIWTQGGRRQQQWLREAVSAGAGPLPFPPAQRPPPLPAPAAQPGAGQ